MAETTRNAPRVPVPNNPGIYKKGAAYQVRWRHNGRESSKSFRTLTLAKQFKKKVDAGETQPTSREPFNAYALRWVETYTGRTAKGVSDSTRASYRDTVERQAIPFFGTTSLDRINPPRLREYIAHLASQGLAPGSVTRAFAPIRAMFATAYEDGMLRSNPASGVRVVVKDTRPKTPKWLTAAQTKRLIAETPASQADLVYFLAATGCRIGEALNAHWADLGHDEHGVILTITKSKTDAGLRTIPLSPDTAQRLTKRRATSCFASEGDLIFPSVDGSAIDQHNWRQRVFKPAAERAGVPWATPHKLRHGNASLLAREGYTPSQIATHLGHADGGVLALKTYIHSDRLSSTAFIDAAFA